MWSLVLEGKYWRQLQQPWEHFLSQNLQRPETSAAVGARAPAAFPWKKSRQDLQKTNLKMLNLIKSQKLTMAVGSPVHLTSIITFPRSNSVTAANSCSFRWHKHLQRDNLHLSISGKMGNSHFPSFEKLSKVNAATSKRSSGQPDSVAEFLLCVSLSHGQGWAAAGSWLMFPHLCSILHLCKTDAPSLCLPALGSLSADQHPVPEEGCRVVPVQRPDLLCVQESRLLRDLESWNILYQVWDEELWITHSSSLFSSLLWDMPFWQQHCCVSLSLSEKLDTEKQQRWYLTLL